MLIQRESVKSCRDTKTHGKSGNSVSLPSPGPNAGHGADCLQRALRSRFRQRLTAGVDMIEIASGCAKRTYKSNFWRNRCVNHHYFLICTQGKS